MKDFRYKLDSGPKKFRCPQCRQKRFVRFVDAVTGNYLDDEFGRCDREVSCGYFCAPGSTPRIERKITLEPEKPVEYFSIGLLEPSVMGPLCNLGRFLERLIGFEATTQLQEKYLFGSSKHWPGATVFWQIDEFERIRYGKIILYNSLTGKRVKDENRAYVTAVHSVIGKPDFNYRQCFFGQHLLKDHLFAKVGLVESEKTAVIASHFLPEYIWLATGGKNGAKLTDSNVIAPLRERAVVMFPDLDAYPEWEEKAVQMNRAGCTVVVSEFLRQLARTRPMEKGADIADILIEDNLKSKGSSSIPSSNSFTKTNNSAALSA